MADYREYSDPDHLGQHPAANRQTSQNQPHTSSQEAGLTPQQIQANRLYEQRQAAQRAQQAQTAQQHGSVQQHAQGARQQGRSDPQRPSVQGQRQFSMPSAGRQPAAAGAQAGPQAAGATFGVPEKQGRGKKKGGIWRVIFWLALIVFIVSLGALAVIGFSYWQEQNMYNEIAQDAFEPPADIAAVPVADLTVDWDALLAKNPDTVGWVYIPGTTVNYPIVQTTDNEKYLKTNFYGETNWVVSPGTIFLSADNKPDFSDPNNMVYGHHMNDGSMFAPIDTFTDPAEFNSHRTVYVLTPQGNYKLETFAIVVVDGDEPLAQTTFASTEEMQAYIQDKMNRSVVTPDPNDITVESITKMFGFATCDYSINNGRAVLFASVVESTVPATGASADAAAETGEEQADPSLLSPEDAAAVGDAAEEL